MLYDAATLSANFIFDEKVNVRHHGSSYDAVSVTRFGSISPLWHNFTTLAQFFKVLGKIFER